MIKSASVDEIGENLNVQKNFFSWTVYIVSQPICKETVRNLLRLLTIFLYVFESLFLLFSADCFTQILIIRDPSDI